jgi:ABC-type lipoprotein release transport system permease subunit
MGTLWKIALRNTIRHGRRTIITAAVMMVGIAVFIFFNSMLAGLDRMAIDNMTDYTLSSMKIRTPAYVDDIEATPLDKGIPHPQQVLSAVAAQGLSGAPRLRFVARLSNYTDEIPVLADAVDPAADAKVFRLANSIASGAWLGGPAASGASSASHAVVLGAELADELKVKVGDAVLISAQTVNDTTNADEYTVVGLVSAPTPEVNRGGLFMTLDDARTLLAAPTGPDGLVTEINISLPRASSLNGALAEGNAAAARLRTALPGMRVDPISQLAAGYLAVRNSKSKTSFIIVLIVLAISAVGIVNTILMSVFSRIREIGVLRAYGMTARDILRLFTLEGLALGLVGSFLGVGFGALLNLFLITHGLDLSAYSQGFGNIPVAGILHGEWDPVTMVLGFLFGIILAVVAARIPARRAARLEPTHALRFQ